jgi:hypothetical protein
VDRKILRFFILIGVAGALLTACAYLASQYPLLLHWNDINLHALSQINCAGDTCDTSTYSTDSESEEPDYIVAIQTGYLIDINTATTHGRFARMDYSDTAFFAQFQHPTSCTTLDGEVWRLYSRSVRVGGNKSLELLVGCTVKAPSKPVEMPESLMSDLDTALERDAGKIARGLPAPQNALRASRSGLSVDGFQVVDPATEQVVEQGPWLPTFYRKLCPCQCRASHSMSPKAPCTQPKLRPAARS